MMLNLFKCNKTLSLVKFLFLFFALCCQILISVSCYSEYGNGVIYVAKTTETVAGKTTSERAVIGMQLLADYKNGERLFWKANYEEALATFLRIKAEKDKYKLRFPPKQEKGLSRYLGTPGNRSLIEEAQENGVVINEIKIPLLGDIPGLGYLFKSKQIIDVQKADSGKDISSNAPAPLSEKKEAIYSSTAPSAKEYGELATPSLTRNKFAAVIGIGEYKSPRVPRLKYSVNDAKEVYEWLISDTGGQFPKENVLFLTNEQAHLQEIKKTLGIWLKNRSLRDDLVFIYFAGHGGPEVDSKYDDGFAKYLLAYDSDPDALYATALPMKEIAEIFNRIESERLVFIADTCFSGAAGGRSIAQKGLRSIRISPTFLNDLGEGRGRVIISASDANEPSIELDEKQHGLFTYYLLEGLNHGDANGDGRITVREVYDYLYEKVARESKLAGASQHPVWKGDIRGDIVLSGSK